MQHMANSTSRSKSAQWLTPFIYIVLHIDLVIKAAINIKTRRTFNRKSVEHYEQIWNTSDFTSTALFTKASIPP